jgi:polysaccharide deacetylase 2 family uncharacterized protein YibQ
MARRRSSRRRRSPLAFLLVVAALGAAFAAGVWIARPRPAPETGREPAARRAPPPAAPRAERARPRAAPPRPVDRAGETSVERPPGPAPRARLALVIDDLGRDLGEVERLLALDVPMSYAVLPFEPESERVALRLREAGSEVLVHLPMEAEGGGDPGPGAVVEGLSRRRITKRTETAIDAVPGATGVNNHMGSRITAEEGAMGAILDVVARRGLFFVDSRTTAETRAFEWARERGIAAAKRDVFLDDDPAEAAVAAQFAAWLDVARANGAAVAIGHPREATLAVLERELPRARAAGFELVPVSFLLERSESLPE